MLTLFIMAGALAADGFAVSICRGVGTSHKWRNAIWTGLVFGAIHAMMIALGWVVGDLLDAWKNIAPYVACAMLVLLGGKMLWEGTGTGDEAEDVSRPENPLMALVGLLWAGVATSVDGVAAGITLPLLGQPLWVDALVVGGVTMLLCVLGYRAGALIGARWGKWAERMGGFCLIAIGLHFVISL
jgi:putative Mn2+ efflux pump MntP